MPKASSGPRTKAAVSVEGLPALPYFQRRAVEAIGLIVDGLYALESLPKDTQESALLQWEQDAYHPSMQTIIQEVRTWLKNQN
jgi:hypothetical protein